MKGLTDTLWIPLWARAVESIRPDALLKDPMAVEWAQRLNCDFSRFSGARMSQTGIAVRTLILDRIVGDYLQEHPEATIINVGAGLDTRFFRLDNGRLHWFEMDLPQVIELKRELAPPGPRYHLISGSILDSIWMEEVSSTKSAPLIIAEGLLFYFPEQEIRYLLCSLATHFPGADVFLELLGPFFVGKARWNDSVKHLSEVEFRWSVQDSRKLEEFHPKIRFIREWYLTDYHRDRWGWLGQAARMGFLKRRLSNRIVHLQFRP